MKNKYKAPKQKKSKGAKGKWRYWMTVACVFGGVGAVFGGTLLGVFATGGFNEKQIRPETIEFDCSQDLFNSDYSQLEVTDSNGSGVFELLLTTPTEEVTEKRVKLSFNDSYPVTKAGGFISNTVIQVPEYVEVGQPFSAKMLTETLTLEGGEKIDWIKGGISLLHAESTDEVFADLKIAVDTPVYTTKTIVYDSNGEQINPTVNGPDSYYEILAGEKFTAESIFVPAKSEYMFADDSEMNEIPEEQRRRKHSFFSAALLDTQANAVTPQYVDKNTVEFLASNKIQSEPVTINAFTFKYADTELTFNEENAKKEALEFYNTAITTLNGKGAAWKSGSSVMIGDAGIEEFSMLNKSTSTIVRGQNSSIFAVYNPSQPKEQYLGASVISNTGRYLDGMLANIGIRFTNAEDKDVTVEEGGNLLEIDSNCQTVLYEGKTYYLPNSNVANIEKSYWNIHARATGTEGDQDVKMEIILFTSTSSPVKVFEVENSVVSYTKTLRISDFEKDVYEWKGEIPTSYTLSYIGSECQKEIVNLRDFIDVSTQEQIKFIVQFPDENGTDDDYEINKMLGQTSYYGKYTVDGLSGKAYILKDSTIALGDTGTFDVYFAVVNPNYNPGEAAYIKTLNIEKQTFTCKKALYDGSVTKANIKLELAAAETAKYVYVGSADSSFNVDFIIAGDSKPAFEEKYKLNRNNFAIVLYDSEGNDITNYFTYTLDPELALYDEGDKDKDGIEDADETFTNNYVLTVEFTLKDNQQIKSELGIDKDGDGTVDADEIFASTLQVARVEMAFEDATTEKLTWGISYDEEDEEFVVDEDFEFKTEKLYVYSPIATEITTTSSIVDNSASKIQVSQTLEANGEFDLEITNPYYLDEVALADEIAKGVVIKDQHNDETSLDGQWKFITDNPEIIKVSGDGKSFTFGTANGESANIQIQSADGKVTATNKCWLTLTTKGVAQLKVDKNADGDFNDAGESSTTDVTQAKVTIDGGEGAAIAEIKSLLKYALEDGTAYNPTTLTASINSKTTSITDMQKISLLGYVYNDLVEDDDNNNIIENDEYSGEVAGWITMTDALGNKIYAIRSSSTDGTDPVIGFTGDITKVKSIVVNKNFAKKETISFNITAKGISTTLDIEILPVASISGETTSYTVYAGKQYDGIDGTALDPADPSDVWISNNVKIAGQDDCFLFDYYFMVTGKTSPLYVCPSVNGYIISETNDNNDSVAQITEEIPYSRKSHIMFNDFWFDESASFTVEFAPDGNNYYAISKTIVFNVQRNVKVLAYSNEGASQQDLIDVQQDSTLEEYFNLYGTNNVNPKDYIRFERIANESSDIPDGIFSYSTKADGVLQVDGTTHNLVKNGITINFALQEYIEQEMYLFCKIDEVDTKFATAKFKVRPLENIYTAVADNLKSSTSKPAKVQTLNGQKYIVVDIANNPTSGWTLTNPLASFDKEKLTIINRYPGGTVRTPLYSGNAGQYTFTGNLSALAGYNSTDKIIVQLSHENYAGVYEYIYLNAIVSSVGNNPVVYANNGNTINSQTIEDKITDYTSRYLEVAMMTPDKLIEKGIYDEVYAGGSYDIFVSADNGLYGAGTVVDYVGIGAENERITNKLIKQLPSTTKNLELYDLADNLGKDYYISLKYTIKNQDFYYVIKVKPNVRSLDPVYPFDGNFENLQENSGKIWLDEPFNNTTLHNGEVRFNVAKLRDSAMSLVFNNAVMGISYYIPQLGSVELKITYRSIDYYYTDVGQGDRSISFGAFEDLSGNSLSMVDGEYFSIAIVPGVSTISYNGKSFSSSTISFVDTIAQVTIDDSKILLNEAEWAKYITAKIVVEGGKSYLSYEAKDNTTPIKVVVRRTFVTSASAEIEQIVDGSIDYVFAINDKSKDYSIRFEEATGATTKDVVTLPDNFGATEYEITFRNGSSYYGLDNTTHKYTGLKVYLVENAVVGDTTSGTVVKDIVRVQKSQDDNGIIVDADYEYTGADNGNFEITLADYIPQDSTAIFTIFTSYGHIATIKFNVLANAEVDWADDANGNDISELTGGQYYRFGSDNAGATDIATLYLNGATFDQADIIHTLTNVIVKENGQVNNDLIANSSVDNGNTCFQIKDLTRDHTVDITFEITLNGYGNKIFTFTKTFKLKANVVAGKAQKYGKEIIAGAEFNVNMTGTDGFDIKTLFEGIAPTNFATVEVKTTNGAYDSCTSWNATSKYFTIKTNYVSIKTVVSTTLTVTLNSGEQIDLGFSFTVVPAVEFSTNYPNPTGEEDGELEMEFVDGNANGLYTKNATAVKGFKIVNLGAFLINQQAVFASGERVVITNASYDGNTVVYGGAKALTVDSVVITGLSNIDVYDVTGFASGALGNALAENEELIDNIIGNYLLVRGSKTNEHSILKLRVECKGVSHEYVIYVSNQLWTAQENYVTTNKVAGQYPETLAWGVTLASDHDYTECRNAHASHTAGGACQSLEQDKVTSNTYRQYITKYIYGFPTNAQAGLKNGDKIYVEVVRAVDTWVNNVHNTSNTPDNNFHLQYCNNSNIVLKSDDGKGKLTYEITFDDSHSGKHTLWVYDGNVGDKITFTRVQNNVTSERIYVDKTNVNNMLEDDRMVTATIAGTAQEGEYYLAYTHNDAIETYTANLDDEYHLGTTVLRNGSIMTVTMRGVIKFTYNGVEYENTLSNKSKTVTIEYEDNVDYINVISEDSTAEIEFAYNPMFFISNAFYIRKDDLGKTLTLDLGLSMTGKTFYGVFKVQDLKDYGIGYKDYASGREIEYNSYIDDEGNTVAAPALDALTKQGVFASAPVLGNRVQLYYGEPLASFPVASSSYSFASEFSCTSGNIDTIYEQQLILKVGTSEVVSDYKYYYMPAIDIDLTNTAALAGAGSSITVEANMEYRSISELFGLIHPSTGQNLSPADAGNVTITLETITDAVARTLPFYNSYLSADGFESFKTVTAGTGRQYLYIEEVQYSNDTYDFAIIPQGADADGDYCLLKITYTVEGFNKEYYVVVKIVPDYNVKFGQDGGQVDANGVISNKNAPYIISTVNTGGTAYADFTLAGTGGHLSITHRNTESKEEIGLSGFEVHLPVKSDDADENNKTNIDNKIKVALGTNMFKLSGTTLTGTTTLNVGNKCDYDYAADKDKKITMSGVPVTVFTSQTFFIEGVDEFGYKYQLYFTLSSTGNQPKAITEGLVINETKEIDIGLQYQLLNVTIADTQQDATISATQMAPTSTSDIPVINISGIDAWLFNGAAGTINEAKSISGNNITVIDKNGSDKTLNVLEESRGYLARADFTKVVVDKIEIYTADGSQEVVDEDENVLALVKDGAAVNNLATSTDAKYFNGTTLVDGRSPVKTWTVPRIPGSYYGSSNKEKFVLRITLLYDGGASGGKEYCTIPVSVEIGRGLDIIPTENSIAIDGEAIDVAAQFDIKDGGNTKTATFINDTLEFVAKPNSVAKFTISATRDGDSIGKEGIVNESNTGVSAYTTKYISISQYIGTNIQAGDKIFISNDSNVDKFYYVTGGTESGTVGQADREVALDANSPTTAISSPNDLIYVYIPAETTVEYKIKLAYQNGTLAEFNLGKNETNKEIAVPVVVSEKLGESIQRGGEIKVQRASGLKLEYNSVMYSGTNIDLTASGYSLVTQNIKADVVYIENQSLLQATLYKNVTKYYIAKVNLASIDYYYRVARDYTVTGSYYSFKPGYTGSIGQTIGNAVGGDFATWSNITSSSTGDTAFVVERAREAVSGKFEAYIPADSAAKEEFIDLLTENLEFEIVNETGSSYGKASMDGSELDIDGDLDVDEYVSVAVYMKVSGLDRDKTTVSGLDSQAISRIKLGVVRLALK